MSKQSEQPTVFRNLPKRRSGSGSVLKWLVLVLLFFSLLGFGLIVLLHLKQRNGSEIEWVQRHAESPPETTPQAPPALAPQTPAPVETPASAPTPAPAPKAPAKTPDTPTPSTGTSPSSPAPAPVSPSAPVSPPPTSPPPPPEPEDPAQREAYREAMEKALGEMMKKQRALETMQAQEWGGQTYSNALASVKTGDAAWQESRYKAAGAAYTKALKQFSEVALRKTDHFDTYMDRGREAIDAGKGEVAREAFDAAVAIRPDDAAAQKGASRAKTIDRVYALLASGEAHEAAGRIAFAQADYTIAKTLDSDFTPAVEALTRVQKKVVESKFNLAMAQGIAAYEKGDFEGAKRVVESAREFDPENPQIAETLEMIKQGILARELGELRRKADEALASEDFDTAIDLYNQALALQPQVTFAREGAKQASDALALWQDIDRYLLEPERINNRNGLANATELAAKAAAFPQPGPQLATKINQLRGMVANANTNIPVTITSDGLTSVDVYRVGRFGPITSRTFNARPGSYTAMGRRIGFRDVRVVIEVKHGAPPPRVDVRCTQPIQ